MLIAALLELKSRLMLPREEEEGLELEPGEAADELLARMLEYRRYRGAAALPARAARGRARLPLPLGAAAAAAAAGLGGGGRGGVRARAARRAPSATCSRTPPPLDLRHVAPARASRWSSGSRHLRDLLRRRGRFALRRGRERAPTG